MSTITAEERALRWRDLENAKHSAKMEGGEVPAEVVAILEQYADGVIDEAEMGRQVDEAGKAFLARTRSADAR